MSYQLIAQGVEISAGAWNHRARKLLTPEFLEILVSLHEELEIRRSQLLSMRKHYYRRYKQGGVPTYDEVPKSYKEDEIDPNWKVSSIPEDLKVRRVEITGPVNDTKMVINMLSRNSHGDRADMAMLDFEDSMKPEWNNIIDGVYNVIGASFGELSFTRTANGKSAEKIYRLDKKDMAGLMVRVRGLHLYENNIKINGEAVSAGLFDLALVYFHTAQNLVSRQKTPKFYIPKIEYPLEARWWNDLFTNVEKYQGHSVGTLRATFLIETLPAAFNLEDILYEIREHCAGMNVGRWDKIFSDIKILSTHTHRISPDRSTINMSKYWMDNYAKRLIKICHRRGAYAIGGMSAFTPGPNGAVRDGQIKKVSEDKLNEFNIGHDGCWVSHPFFIGPALKCFTKENQLNVLLSDFEERPDLIMDGEGPRTLEGLRTNIRVGIAYLRGWNAGLGCVAFNNMMEDLATLEISRAQVWQWLKYSIELDCGTKVTRAVIGRIFREELTQFFDDIKATDNLNKLKVSLMREYEKAAIKAEQLFTEKELAPFLSMGSEIEPDPVDIEIKIHTSL